jgi:FolB domain-containing protein
MKLRQIFIRNWNTRALVGIYPYEKKNKTPLRLNITLYQQDRPAPRVIDDVICYDSHKQRMSKVIQSGHHALLETLAEKLIFTAFKDVKVQRVKVEIAKLGIFTGVESCGVIIERDRKG